MIAGVLSLDEGWSPKALANELAKASCRYPSLAAQEVIGDHRVVCYQIQRRDDSGLHVSFPLSDGVDLTLIGELGCPHSYQQVLQKEIASQGIRRLFDQTGLWVAIMYDSKRGVLRLAVDPLGVAWVYIVRFERGYMFCSDFGALVSHYPESVTPDNETILVMLAMGYTPDEKTCFKEVTVLPPGTLVELRNDGVHTVFKRQIEYGDRYASLSTRQKHELLDGIYDRTAQEWLPAAKQDFVVSFSGGYDSRYGLAMLNKQRIPAPCRIFGNPRNREVRSARAMCEQLNFEASVYDIDRTSWEGWKRCVQQVGVVGGFHQWGGWGEDWMAMLQKDGSKVLIGYLGDALSGKHLVPTSSNDGNWLEDWETWSLEGGWAGSLVLRPEAIKLMRECVRQRLEEASRQANYAFPHQTAMHLDWYGRQRRFVASQPNMIARFLSPVVYFYTTYGLEFWSNLPMDDLEDQRLYISYATSRFPDLFHQPRPATLGERFRGAGENLLIGLLPNMKEYIAPREVNNRMLIMEHQSRFVSLVDEMSPVVESIVDTRKLLKEMKAFPKSSYLSASQLLCFVNLAILLNSALRPN